MAILLEGHFQNLDSFWGGGSFADKETLPVDHFNTFHASGTKQ